MTVKRHDLESELAGQPARGSSRGTDAAAPGAARSGRSSKAQRLKLGIAIGVLALAGGLAAFQLLRPEPGPDPSDYTPVVDEAGAPLTPEPPERLEFPPPKPTDPSMGELPPGMD